MKICPVETKLFHMNGRRETDKMKLTVTFRNFADAPKLNCETHY
jgi:hypothetical protein